MTFSMKTRTTDIDKLKHEQLDLLVVGGGITGAGIALQASAAGMKNALIDMQDFSAGTSSRSTRLVHGGIRYLKTFDVEVVAETSQERAVIQHVAPHVTRPKPMLMPIYDEPGTTFTMFSVKVAMDLYDRLAGINDSDYLHKYANYTLNKEQVLDLEPQLNPDKLVGGGVYLDYLNNDSRLVIENIKQAHALGGIMVSHLKAIEILHNETGAVCGVKVEDTITREQFDILAKIVINAAGPWSDLVKDLDSQHDNKHTQMRPTKGIHLVVDQSRLKVPQPTYFGSGTNDGRMIFTIPRDGKTYFGTTDTDYQGDLTDPKVDQADVDYLLAIINKKYPTAKLTLDDVESSWAGIRPLIVEKSAESDIDVVSGASNAGNDTAASAVSRGSSLKRAHDGLITLAGGKLTDYRKMADGAMKMIVEILNQQCAEKFQTVDSSELKVSGGDFDSTNAENILNEYVQDVMSHGIHPKEAQRIVHLFGTNYQQIIKDIDQTRAAEGLSLAETLCLRYAMDEEMTLTPGDYLFRRTNHLLFNHDHIKKLESGIIKEMSRYFGWSDAVIKFHTEQTDALISEAALDYLK